VKRVKVVSTIGVLALIAGATVAQSAARKVSIKSPVQAGRAASLAVNGSSKAKCTITVRAGSYVPTPRGLAPKTGGRITWRWQLRTNARPGQARPR